MLEILDADTGTHCQLFCEAQNGSHRYTFAGAENKAVDSGKRKDKQKNDETARQALTMSSINFNSHLVL